MAKTKEEGFEELDRITTKAGKDMERHWGAKTKEEGFEELDGITTKAGNWRLYDRGRVHRPSSLSISKSRFF